jgi:hypothetical protein
MSEGTELEIIETRPPHGGKRKKAGIGAKLAEAEAAAGRVEIGGSSEVECRVENAKEAELVVGSEQGNELIEVEVIKPVANPRLVLAKYVEAGEEQRILVYVRRSVNFRAGMKLKLERPVDWASRIRPWEYKGRLPRLPGRW